MTREGGGFKTGVDGDRSRRVVVSAVKAEGRPLVHLKLRAGVGDGSRGSDTIDMSPGQAAALVDALNAAIKVAGTDPVIEEAEAADAARKAAQRAEDQAWEAAAPRASNRVRVSDQRRPDASSLSKDKK